MSLPRAGAETGETPLGGSWGAGERKVGPVAGGHECGVRWRWRKGVYAESFVFSTILSGLAIRSSDVNLQGA